MLKFLLRVIGIGRYKIFIALSDSCWRQRRCGTFIRFSKACQMADRCALFDNIDRSDYTVAISRDGKELYRSVCLKRED